MPKHETTANIRPDSMKRHIEGVVRTVLQIDDLLLKTEDTCNKEQLREMLSYLEKLHANCEGLTIRVMMLIRNRIDILND